MNLIEDAKRGLNQPEFSVSEISGAIQRLIEGEFAHVRVKGEIGRVSLPRSGHIYLDLKDDRSVLSAIIWRGVAARLRMQPEEGLEVIVTGNVTTFKGQSKYQIIIDDIKPAGVGALMAMLEKRKALLAQDGLFEQNRKKPIPFLPEVIGVVTSPSGAVIRDILSRLKERFPRQLLIWPVVVQGDKCALEVSKAINGFNALEKNGPIPRPDVLIVARGGGSLEDLWGFNEEIVVRAVANSSIPLISAVGHETDTTLIDFASDLRASTPTAAAELAVPLKHELSTSLIEYRARMSRSVSTILNYRRQRLQDLVRALPKPESLIAYERQKLDPLGEGLPKALYACIQKSRMRLSDFGGLLRPSSALSKVDRAKAEYHQLWPRLAKAHERRRKLCEIDLSKLSIRLMPDFPVRKLKDCQASYVKQNIALLQLIELHISRKNEQIAALDRLLETLGYTATLNRGYAVVRSGKSLITSVNSAKITASLEVEFRDGRLSVSTKKRESKRSKTSNSEQDSLF